MPEKLGKAISELITTRGLARSRANAQLQEIWREAAGDDIADQTRLQAIKRGVLHIGVKSAPLMSELIAFRKTELLESLQQVAPHLRVRDLKFTKIA